MYYPRSDIVLASARVGVCMYEYEEHTTYIRRVLRYANTNFQPRGLVKKKNPFRCSLPTPSFPLARGRELMSG